VQTGLEFADLDVVRAYRHRADYPAALYDHLLTLTPGHTRLLDLGCGPGKLAAGLAPAFTEVVAADPSRPMLDVARDLHAAGHPNIFWVEATGEALRLDEPLDLVVAGASIHWMDPAIVFPKLHGALRQNGVLAVIGGDGPAAAEWLPAWQAVCENWITRFGGTWNDVSYRQRMSAHESWFEVEGERSFESRSIQPIEQLIEAQHSRATWARSTMGDAAQAFDNDLRDALASHAMDGAVEFTVRCQVTWGRPRAASSAGTPAGSAR
jgi:SAM-dependent methyltransferase